MNNDTWGQKLRDGYNDKTGESHNIQLPAANHILFDGEKDCIKVNMKEKAVVANMATNVAAFEAWSLALRVWCEVETIELSWDPPSRSTSPHYQRFLYRAERFRSLFPDWFHLARPLVPTEAAAFGAGPFFLNVPGAPVPRERPTSQEEERDLRREADVEKHLVECQNFASSFQLEKLDRQFPVGLFHTKRPASDSRIFTGGKSAIDIVGVGNGTLSLFELKVRKNNPAGILSELFFYANVMRDAIPGAWVRNARFQFADHKSNQRAKIYPADVQACKSIEAILLGEDFHPLVGHRCIIESLNNAAKRFWNESPLAVPVHFRAVRLEGSVKAGYKYRDVETKKEIIP